MSENTKEVKISRYNIQSSWIYGCQSNSVIPQHDPGDNPPPQWNQRLGSIDEFSSCQVSYQKSQCHEVPVMPHLYIQGNYTMNSMWRIIIWKTVYARFRLNLIIIHEYLSTWVCDRSGSFTMHQDVKNTNERGIGCIGKLGYLYGFLQCYLFTLNLIIIHEYLSTWVLEYLSTWVLEYLSMW